MATPEEIAAQFQEEQPENNQPEDSIPESEDNPQESGDSEEVSQPSESEDSSDNLSELDNSSEEEKLEAARLGWKPDGTDKHGKHRTAHEFLERGSEIARIRTLEKQLQKNNETIELLKKHSETTAERAYQRAVEDFKKQKLEAAEIGDTQRMLDIDEQIDKLEKPLPIHTEPGITQEQDDLAKEYEKSQGAFRIKNDWYETDRVKTAFANQEGAAYAQRVAKETGSIPHPDDVFRYMEEEVAKEFPQTTHQRVTTTQTRSVNRGPKRKGWNDVDDAAREIGKKLISRGAITEEQYLKDYFGE